MLALLQLRRVALLWLLSATALPACLVSVETRGRWQVLTEDRTWPPPLGILNTHFTDDERGWAVTPFALLQTRNGGKTWAEKFNGGDEDDFLSIAFVDNVRGVIVGGERKGSSHVALFWNTTDGGASWIRHTDYNIPPLSSVSFCSRTTGYAAGSGAVVFTSDGGWTWMPLLQSERDLHLMSVACFDSLRVYCGRCRRCNLAHG
ncbi:MAG TPA: YCF48-related protein [Blastocatellia bacterium]|nr:YCF48-related protein [Blastocatellia bacterium]